MSMFVALYVFSSKLTFARNDIYADRVNVKDKIQQVGLALLLNMGT